MSDAPDLGLPERRDPMDRSEAPVIWTSRTMLRPIVETDVGEVYLSWFSDPEVFPYSDAARTGQTIDSLRAFIRDRVGRSDVWFHGIFSRVDATLVGTIKCEPIDVASRIAVMGILIGDSRFRGIGIAGEVIPEVAAMLRRRRGIHWMELGVDPGHERALRVYGRIGFRPILVTASKIRMRLDIPETGGEGGGDAGS